MDRRRQLWFGAICSVLLGTDGGCGGTNIPQGIASDAALDVPADLPIDMAEPEPDADLPDGGAPSCPAGQHLCPVGCVNNDSPQTCGGSCTPCLDPGNGGTATCNSGQCDGRCPTGKQLCFGACIDSAATCSGGCSDGTHLCGRSCPNTMDVNACGASCGPCPVPANVTNATCDGTKCGFTCKSGYHVCGQTCAASTDVSACGDDCMVCPTDPNGAAICAGGLCAIQCSANYHLCGNKCVSNGDVGSCGPSSCEACQNITGGTATCDDQKCGGTCPAGQVLCKGACIPSGQVCGDCRAGTHNCSGVCVDSNSANSCGTLCSACPKPDGANQTSCDGTTCDFTCGTAYHRCGTACAANDDATACGASCTKCPTDPNGVATCQQSGTCSLSCNTGYHLCNSHCVSTKDPNNCGAIPCGVTCTAPTGGTVSCDGVSCLAVCPSPNQYVCQGACIDKGLACSGECIGNTHNCSGFCRANDTMSCGPTCLQCPVPPANGQATCNGTSCGILCTNNFRNCAGSSFCISTAAPACCANADCTAGPVGTIGVCSNNSCMYPCNSPTYKACGNACILASRCCTSTDCPSSKPICSEGACVGRALGGSCNGGAECADGKCVDGVCCSTGSCPTCQRCNLNGAGTCSASPAGGETACPISAANCTAGCDGFGNCQAAQSSTLCAPSTCTGSDSLNGAAHVGVFTSITFSSKRCDGVTAGSAGCKIQPDSNCDNLICANATSCKQACSANTDCVYGFRCLNSVCQGKKANGAACTLPSECLSGICSLDVNNNGPACRGCISGGTCPRTTPGCSDALECTLPCRSVRDDPNQCSPDGSYKCTTEFAIPATATDCDTQSLHFHCGALEQCPGWMVCQDSTCKVTGGQPCLNATDCASGICLNGRCGLNASGSRCTGDFGEECATGLVCSALIVNNGTQFVPTCVPQ